MTKELDVHALDPARFDRLVPSRLFSLEGKVAVVTGAAGGIGTWLSAGLGRAGAQVLVTDREEGSTVAVSRALQARGLDVSPLPVDLEASDAAQRIVGTAVERYGRLDVLINNAGINRRLSMLEVTHELLEHIWTVDYLRCYELSQAAVRVMIPRGVRSPRHSDERYCPGLYGHTHEFQPLDTRNPRTVDYGSDAHVPSRPSCRTRGSMSLVGIGRGIFHQWPDDLCRWWLPRR